jgi:hypothetical protein
MDLKTAWKIASLYNIKRILLVRQSHFNQKMQGRNRRYEVGLEDWLG